MRPMTRILEFYNPVTKQASWQEIEVPPGHEVRLATCADPEHVYEAFNLPKAKPQPTLEDLGL